MADLHGSTARRIGAMLRRYVYLLRHSWPRLVELTYWPTLNMILWGLVNQFMAETSSWVAAAGGILLAGVLLWEVLFRSQIGLSLSFLEEYWSRNIGNLFVSPLRPGEWIAALMAISLLRTLVGLGPAALLAWILYEFSVFDLGLPLVAFFANLLVMGWWLGLISAGLILRYGLGAESLAWMITFILAPVSAVYYPVSNLPEALHWVSWILPSTHVFEGMRAVMLDGDVRLGHLAAAVGLNAVYLAAASGVFLYFFAAARRQGSLLQTGE